MANALPTHPKDDTNSDISSSYEAIALFSHACMIAVGFRLVGYGEGQKMEEECEKLAPRLSNKWNSSFGSHSFLYAHSQSSMQFVVKVDRLGGKAEIRGIGLGDERISRFEIVAKDYVSSAALPLRITIREDGEEDRSNLKQKLQDVFISPSRINGTCRSSSLMSLNTYKDLDLASLFKINIIQKLVPSLQKEGYEESQSEASRVYDEREEGHGRRNPNRDPLADPGLPAPARPYPFDDTIATGPRRSLPVGDFPPPGFDDEYDLNRPLRGMAPPFPGAGSPFNIGHDDLNPPGLGPYDPLRGSFVGGGARGGFGGGGMHPTFDDPLFGGRAGNGGFNPQAPPGARYDPTWPGDGPPNPFGGSGRGGFL